MNALYLTLVFPLLGFLLLVFGRQRCSENVAAMIGVGSIGLSASCAIFVGYDFLYHPPTNQMFVQTLWTWLHIEQFAPQFALHLDGLSLTMLGVITGVGFWIHLFASWYMRGEAGYARFFAYMNLFIASMILLVMGNNLVTLFFGWEGVGFCSYLLIGFYYQNSANGAAARKAFVITRVGDVLMLLGLCILFQQVGTLTISELLLKAPQIFTVNDPLITLATLLLLGGALGKSAQLPLQTWLADAMAGPTPVSALIHAATMVTAGVYLIARLHGLFELAPDVLYLVGCIGAATLVLAGFAALAQTDIKRILAYSTMSQIGYMFLALGVKAYAPAIFHLMTHAFFKALLFLSSGAVILACHHEQNIFKMGGLRKTLPLVYLCFLIGGAALSALPFLTAGFYSKDEILWEAFTSGHNSLFYAGLFGALLTSLYTFRLIFIVFHGEAKILAHGLQGIDYRLPLIVLMILSTAIGALIHPPLANIFPAAPNDQEALKQQVEWVSGSIALVGIALAAFLFVGDSKLIKGLAGSLPGIYLRKFWLAGWGFDWLYAHLLVNPFVRLSRYLLADPIDQSFNLIPATIHQLHHQISTTQTGSLRGYATVIFAGLVILLLIFFIS